MNPDKSFIWSPAKKFGTLFLFVYFILQIIPMLSRFFIGDRILDVYYYPSFFVQNYILQLHETPNWVHVRSGGADTLDDWIQQLAYLLIAILVAGIWMVVDKKRKEYSSLYQYTKIAVRYFLGSVMFLYGIQKLFLLQMVYPKLSYFYTPLGDFKPMDLAWTFVGYSAAYQFIGGLMEFVAGALIFFRRTLVPGLLIFLGVMSNVLMLNYFYGVAVKTFSTTLVLLAIFLLLEYVPKLIDFFLLQKSAKIETPGLNLDTTWKKRARVILKYGYISFGLIWLIVLHLRLNARVNSYSPIAIEGAYDVHAFEVNGTANTDYFDASRWNQVVVNPSPDGMSSSGHVSLGTTKRELASFKLDSLNQLRITFGKDSALVFKGRHRLAADSLIWTGLIGKDSIEMVLKKNERELTLRDSPFLFIMDAGDAENLRTRK